MKRARLLLAFALLLMLGGFDPIDAAAEKAVIQIVAPTSGQVDHAQWALSRFAAVGLELPSLTIEFHDNYESCGMREGVLRIAGEVMVVHECERDPARLRRSLLHELAHAWDHLGTQISDEGRGEFLRLRGLVSWDDDDLPWSQRGEEQAAEIIAWGLMLRPVPIPTSVGDHGPQDPSDLARAFVVLTGVEPPFDSLRK
jgi:hypothetical protein